MIGSLLFLVAFALRLDLVQVSPVDAEAVFHIGLIVITLACGWRRAGWFAALSAASVWFFFLRSPTVPGLPAGAGPTALALGSFALLAGVEIAVAEALATAAAVLTSQRSAALDPRLAALHRRAQVAARFVADPALGPAPRDGDAACDLAAVRSRLDRFLRIDRAVLNWAVLDWAVLDDRADGTEWADLMAAFCRARVAATGAAGPQCRISGATAALPPDRLLAISLAVAELLDEAMAARCGVFEVRLRTSVAAGLWMGSRSGRSIGGSSGAESGRCTLEISMPGARNISLAAEAAPAMGARAVRWLGGVLDASITLSAAEEGSIRLDFIP
jgi:hypothetical protein